MPFKNENTYINMKAAGREKEFDDMYEASLKEVREKYFNREYPLLLPHEETGRELFDDISPINTEVIAKFQKAKSDDVDSAVSFLKKSYKAWYEQGYIVRARKLLAAADIMAERKFELAALLAYEHGKNRYEAMGDVDEAIDFMRYYALNLIENQGFDRFTGKGYENEESRSVMKPYGVFAVIAPFNFFSITVGMTVGPLVTGNSVLLKPSSDIPLASYLFVKILVDAGIPSDVIAFITGSGSVIGNTISSHDQVDGIVFTGSRETGMSIFHNATKKRVKPVITEMGGKDAIIVTSKADLDKASDGVMRSAFGYSGQKCSACSIAYVDDSIYDKFMNIFIEKVKKITPRDPKEKDAFVTPVINKQAFEKYKKIIEQLPNEGKILTGAKVLDRDGYYVEPTVVTDVKEDSFILKQELFLPIIAVVRVDSLNTAIEKINELDYGLTGGIFTEDPEEIKEYFDNIEVGVIYANRRSGGSSGAMVGSQPFVGWKASGSTGKGTGSFYYLSQFLREQSQTIAH